MRRPSSGGLCDCAAVLIMALLLSLSQGVRAADAEALASTPAMQQDDEPRRDDDLTEEDILEMDIGQLLSIPVTRVATVAGVPRPLLETPSAMTVITGEDIRRTGHRSVAEAMRLVPGMYVARSSSHTWRIGARGFAGILAPRNLVLIDGRTVYDPAHGGVFWEVQDVVFEDLDRIEVIRGPGATLWGANAMNGVVNVISKSAHETQGLLLKGGTGTYERGFGTFRYGDTIDEDTAFRVYGRYFNRDRFREGTGDANDDWSMLSGGFRLDRNVDEDTTFTVISEGYGSLTMGEPGLPEDRRVSGAHMLARIAHETEDRSGWTLQTYYDRTNRAQAAGSANRDTFDIDFRHFFPWGEGSEFIWGLNYRFTTDRTEADTVVFDPRSRSLNIFQAFVQNTFTLAPERLYFMLGTKIGYYSYTDFEIQPGARLWWTPDDRQSIWAAVSRSVRIPSRLEQDGEIFAVILPGENLDAEELFSYELGHRVEITPQLSLDTTLFYNDYSDLISLPAGTPPAPGPWNNRGSGESYGVELAAECRVADNWRLGAGYSFVRVHVHGPINPFEEGSVPQHQGFLRSHLDITDHWLFDTIFYYYDNMTEDDISSYGRLDLGLTWRPSNTFELSVWGQNVTDRSTSEATRVREFPRGVYLIATLRF